MCIVWNDNDPWRPGKDRRCTMCCGPLHLPVVIWFSTYRGDDDENVEDLRYFCSECCAEIQRGFSNDLKQMATAKQIRDLGFREGARKASDGELFVPGENSQH